MFMKGLRLGLGQLILLGDAVSRPRPQRRGPQGQAIVEKKPRGYRCISSIRARSASRLGAPCIV